MKTEPWPKPNLQFWKGCESQVDVLWPWDPWQGEESENRSKFIEFLSALSTEHIMKLNTSARANRWTKVGLSVEWLKFCLGELEIETFDASGDEYFYSDGEAYKNVDVLKSLKILFSQIKIVREQQKRGLATRIINIDRVRCRDYCRHCPQLINVGKSGEWYIGINNGQRTSNCEKCKETRPKDSIITTLFRSKTTLDKIHIAICDELKRQHRAISQHTIRKIAFFLTRTYFGTHELEELERNRVAKCDAQKKQLRKWGIDSDESLIKICSLRNNIADEQIARITNYLNIWASQKIESRINLKLGIEVVGNIHSILIFVETRSLLVELEQEFFRFFDDMNGRSAN